MRLKNRTEEIREEYKRVGEELGSFKAAHRVAAEKAFIDAGGCDKCRGRGWVVTWDTLDCIRGSYAQYASCPSDSCTPDSREMSGLAPGNSKYDQWNRNSTWHPTYTPEESKELDALDHRWRGQDVSEDSHSAYQPRGRNRSRGSPTPDDPGAGQRGPC